MSDDERAAPRAALPERGSAPAIASRAPRLPSPRRILVVSDLGPAGRRALREGARRARAGNAALAIVHAIPVEAAVRAVFTRRSADDALRLRTLPRLVRSALLDQHAAEAPDGPPAELFVSAGPITTVTAEAAARWRAELIVIGAELIDEAVRLVRRLTIPVLIARAGDAGGPVVACTDLSDPALPALQAAARAAHASGAPLHLIHALPSVAHARAELEGAGLPPPVTRLPARRTHAERRIAGAAAAIDARASTAVVDGAVVPEVASACAAHGAGLLVVGATRHAPLDVEAAEALARHAPCSTMLVPLAPAA